MLDESYSANTFLGNKMTVYLITILLVFIVADYADRQRVHENGLLLPYSEQYSYRKIVMLTAAILIFVAGFRYQVGTDYGNYRESFIHRGSFSWNAIKSFEPGYNFIIWINKLIYDDYGAMFFMVSLVTIWLNVKTISKYCDTFCLSILLYIFIGAWTGSFNGIRQYLAAAILFAGHRLIIERRFFKYCVIVLFASFIHITALIMFPVYFIADKRITLRTIIAYFIVCIIMRFSYDYFFSIMSTVKGSDQTVYEYMQTNVNVLRTLVNIAPACMLCLLTREYKDDVDNIFYFNMLILNAVFMASMTGSAYLARIGIYTEIYITLALPKIVNAFDHKDRKILVLSIVVLYLVFFLYGIHSGSLSRGFQWIWNR